MSTPRRAHILVKVAILPGKIVEIVLNGGRTVEKAFEVAGLEVDTDRHEITVNDRKAEMDSAVKNGDVILAAENCEAA